MNAPLALFVYNRPDHALRTLMSLKENDLSGIPSYIFFQMLQEKAMRHLFGKLER